MIDQIQYEDLLKNVHSNKQINLKKRNDRSNTVWRFTKKCA